MLLLRTKLKNNFLFSFSQEHHIHPLSDVSQSHVYMLFFLVFALLFFVVLSVLLCSYCKRRMYKQKRYQKVDLLGNSETDSESNTSGSWISIDSSTQVTSLLATPSKEEKSDIYWFRHNQVDISPSIIV